MRLFRASLGIENTKDDNFERLEGSRGRQPQWSLSVRLFAYLMWFFSGIGSIIAWTAMSNGLLYFTGLYGPSIYLYFLTAYNVPVIPLLWLQMRYDTTMDIRYGTAKAFFFRMLLGYLLLGGLVASIPFLPSNMYLVIGMVVLFGGTVGIGSGALFQLVSAFPSTCTAFLGSGQSAAAILILVLQLTTKFNGSPSRLSIYVYFGGTALITVFCLICFVLLIKSRYGKYYMRTKDVALQTDAALAVLRRTSTSKPRRNSIDFSRDDSEILLQREKRRLLIQEEEAQLASKKPKWSTAALLKQAWKSEFGIVWSYFCDLVVGSAVTFIPTDNPLMPVILVYLSNFGVFLGRQFALLPERVQVKNGNHLLAFVLSRTAFVVMFMVYIMAEPFRSDYFIFALAAGHNIMSGYAATRAYYTAPQGIPPIFHGQVASIMNIFLQVGVYMGLAFSFLVKFVIIPSLHR